MKRVALVTGAITLAIAGIAWAAPPAPTQPGSSSIRVQTAPRPEAQSGPAQDASLQNQAGRETKQVAWDARTVREVQHALKEKKLYKGDETGIFDGDTGLAVRKFQEKNKLGATGQLDRPTLAKLGVTPSAY